MDEAGCYRAVHRLYDWLVETRGFRPEDIIVDGFSIGTGPAVELAVQETIREAICRGKAVTLGHTGIAHGIAPGHMVSVLGFSNEGRHVHLLDPYGRVVVASASMLSSYPTYVEA